MRFILRSAALHRCVLSPLVTTLILASFTPSFASACNAHPKLIVVIAIDQFRGDYIEHYRNKFPGGFRLLLDHGSFTDCNCDYINSRSDFRVGNHTARHCERASQ